MVNVPNTDQRGHRTALSTVVNICRKLPSECPAPIMDTVPRLCDLLHYELVENVIICLLKIAERVKDSPDMLNELCKHGLVKHTIHLIGINSRTNLSQTTYSLRSKATRSLTLPLSFIDFIFIAHVLGALFILQICGILTSLMELRANQPRDVELDWRGIAGRLIVWQRLLQKKICVILLLKGSKLRGIDSLKLWMLVSRGGLMYKKETCVHCFQHCNMYVTSSCKLLIRVIFLPL